MDLKQFNFLILFTDGRFQTMSNMTLDNDLKLELAKTGLFFHNNIIKCIGCYITMDKIDIKRVKRHTYSDNCISSTNLLMINEVMRKKSFVSFKACRCQFKSQRIVDMLARRGFYSFGKTTYLRCSGCHVVFKYKTVDHAQQQHKKNCIFINAVDDNLIFINKKVENNYEDVKKQILLADLPPPRIDVMPSAPDCADLSQQISECKICFNNEKSVCFMPCRHLVACTQCSRLCKKCCVCNAKIMQRIETLPQ